MFLLLTVPVRIRLILFAKETLWVEMLVSVNSIIVAHIAMFFG